MKHGTMHGKSHLAIGFVTSLQLVAITSAFLGKDFLLKVLDHEISVGEESLRSCLVLQVSSFAFEFERKAAEVKMRPELSDFWYLYQPHFKSDIAWPGESAQCQTASISGPYGL